MYVLNLSSMSMNMNGEHFLAAPHLVNDALATNHSFIYLFNISIVSSITEI